MPKSKAPAQTFEEPTYLRSLVERRAPIRVHLVGGEVVEGVIEYWDSAFLRLTREGDSNLFIFKDHIKYFDDLDS